MNKNHRRELPVQAKMKMAEGIAKIIGHLHRGEREKSDLLLEELKERAVYMPEDIQQDVLMFSEAIQFQYDYDPWHKVSEEVQKTANRLIEALGMNPPR